jgi:hypothetical protein
MATPAVRTSRREGRDVDGFRVLIAFLHYLIHLRWLDYGKAGATLGSAVWIAFKCVWRLAPSLSIVGACSKSSRLG